MIEYREVVRTFGALRALDGLSFQVPAGHIYALLGHNGAGKTTALRMAIGLTIPTSGGVYLSGLHVEAHPVSAKAVSGFLPDSPSYYPHLSADGYLEFLAKVRGLDDAKWKPRRDDLLERLGLADQRSARMGDYSFGMTRKAALAGVLLHEPTHLLLDEPTAGLDPASVRALKDLMLEERARGAALLVSSHDLDAVAEVADHLGILNHGRLIRELARKDIPPRGPDGVSPLERLYLATVSDGPAPS
jgi:ABC-2 type transport system ATP-binding protein